MVGGEIIVKELLVWKLCTFVFVELILMVKILTINSGHPRSSFVSPIESACPS